MVDILREVGMIDRALDSIANIKFKKVDLARGQYLYLVRIYEHPGIISEQLSNLIKVDRTTIARAVKKLEINGLIERRHDPDCPAPLRFPVVPSYAVHGEGDLLAAVRHIPLCVPEIFRDGYDECPALGVDVANGHVRKCRDQIV